jgi:hypothetical protein
VLWVKLWVGKIDVQRILAWLCGHAGLASGRTWQTNLPSGRAIISLNSSQDAMWTPNYNRSHGDISNARLLRQQFRTMNSAI